MGVLLASLGLTVLAAATPAAACPSHEQVDAELERMGEQAALARLGRYEVTGAGNRLRLVLLDSAGEALGAREVDAPADCQQRAGLAAVVLAAWAASWGQTALGPRPEPPKPVRLEIGAWASGHQDGERTTWGGGLGAGLASHAGWGVAALGDWLAERQVALGPGQGAYSFMRLGAGPTWRLSRGALWTDLGLFPQLIRLALQGKGLGESRSAVRWGAAGQARARVGWQWGWGAPFISAAGGRCFIRDRLTLDDAPESTTLSPWDVSLGVGLAVVLGG